MNLVPLNNAAQQLVNGEDGTSVRDVMVGGEFVLRDGGWWASTGHACVARAQDAGRGG